MAFMGIILMYLFIIIIVLAIAASTSVTCFVTSSIIMAHKRRKMQSSEKIEPPWYVIVLRVIGTIATIPCVGAVVLIIWAEVSTAIDKNTNLPRAVMNYDFEQAEKILDNGADPDERDRYGSTLLMCLADHSSYVPFEDDEYYRFDYEYDWNQADENDIRMMKILLEHGADINAQKIDCEDKSLHERGDDEYAIYANSEHSCGNTALACAVRFRSTEMISFLIENGADVNIGNSCGFTPLLMCVDNRTDEDGAEIAKMLIEAGADLNAVTNFQQDIFFLLIRRNDQYVDEMKKIIVDNLED